MFFAIFLYFFVDFFIFIGYNIKNGGKMFKLSTYLKKYKFLVALGPFFKVLETITDILSPFLVALMIDKGVVNNDINYIITVGIIVIAMNLFGFACAVICQKCSALASQGIGRDIRSDMFRHINTYSHAEFDRFSTMSLTNRSVHDVHQVQHAIGMTIRQISRAPLLLIGCTIMAMIIDFQLSLSFLILIPILTLAIYFIMKKTSPIYSQAKQKLDNVSNVTRENLSGVRVVRAFNKQEYEKKRFLGANNQLTDSNIKVGNIGAVFQPLLMIVIMLCEVSIVWLGGFRVNDGFLTTGNIIAFINYFGFIASAIVVIARILLTYSKTGASMRRIREVFEIKNSLKEKSNPTPIDFTKTPKIEFKNVSFSYKQSKEVVKNLSFVLEPGQTLGIIGGTGAGKSSVINLIPRFYDASHGEVLINDINVKNYSIKELREYVGIVPQQNILFKGTIGENLRWRKENATDMELTKALQLAQALSFVKEYPDFLNHRVERGGTNFSGGQKQRLTIARALVGDPKILILDDSSSALDFATDAELKKAIYRNLKNLTVVMVTQRASAIKNADKIIVLDNGSVAGVGTHNQLMQTCEVYQEIYNSQNK